MIGDIRNPWIRRPVVVLTVAVMFVVLPIAGVLDGLSEAWDVLRTDARRAWKGC